MLSMPEFNGVPLLAVAAQTSTSAPLDLSVCKTKKSQDTTVCLSKCAQCTYSRVSQPLIREKSWGDGVTCDFCGIVMEPVTSSLSQEAVAEPEKISSTGNDVKQGQFDSLKKYLVCPEPGCGETVLNTNMAKHFCDMHGNRANARSCPHCDKMLSSAFALREHIASIHNQEANNECSQCGARFAYRANLVRHVRTIHEKRLVSKKYVSCHICHKRLQKNSLKVHLNAIHGTQRYFKCPKCPHKNTRSSGLKEHYRAVHTRVHPYSCKLCGKTFAHRANCVRHIRAQHEHLIHWAPDPTLPRPNDLSRFDSYNSLVKELLVFQVDPEEEAAMLSVLKESFCSLEEKAVST